MGAPVASGTLAGSTSRSAASIHREAASSDITRSVDTLRSYDSHTLPTVAESDIVVGHNFPNREKQRSETGVAGVVRFVPSRSDWGRCGSLLRRASDS